MAGHLRVVVDAQELVKKRHKYRGMCKVAALVATNARVVTDRLV